MTDNSAGPNSPPSREQLSSAEEFLKNGDFSQFSKLADGFKDILDNKQNFNFEVKDIGGGQYQAKASSVYQPDSPNFQKAVSVDLNENDVKKLNDLNKDRLNAETKPEETKDNKPAGESKKAEASSPGLEKTHSAINSVTNEMERAARFSEKFKDDPNKKELHEKMNNTVNLNIQAALNYASEGSSKENFPPDPNWAKDNKAKLDEWSKLPMLTNETKGMIDKAMNPAQPSAGPSAQQQQQAPQRPQQEAPQQPRQQSEQKATAQPQQQPQGQSPQQPEQPKAQTPQQSGDMKAKIEGLGQKRDDFANKVKAIGSAEGKEDKFKAVMEAYKAGKELKKEANKLDKEMRGKQSQKKGKSSSSASEKDEDEEIGSLYAALMAIINGMKDMRKQVKDIAQKENVELPKPKMLNDTPKADATTPQPQAQTPKAEPSDVKALPEPSKPEEKKGEKAEPAKADATTSQPQAQTPKAEPTDVKALPEPPKPEEKKGEKAEPVKAETNQKASGPANSGPTEGQKDLAKNVAQDAVVETVKSGGQPEVGVVKAAVKNAPQIMEEGKKLGEQSGLQGQGGPQESQKKEDKKDDTDQKMAKASGPESSKPQPGMSNLKSGGMDLNSEAKASGPENAKPKAGMSNLKPGGMDLNSEAKASGPESAKPQPGMSNLKPGGMDLNSEAKASGPENAKPQPGMSNLKSGGMDLNSEAKASGPESAKPKAGMSNLKSGGMDLNSEAKASGPENAKPQPGMSNLKSGRMDVNSDSNQNQSSPEKAKGESDDPGKKMAMEGGKMAATAAISGATGLPPQVTKMGVDAGASALENQGGESKSSGPSMPGGEAKAGASAKGSKSSGPSGGSTSSGPSSGGSKGSGMAGAVLGGAVEAVTTVGQGLSELGEMAKKASSRLEEKTEQGAGAENNAPNSSAGAGGPQKSGESKSAGLAASFQGVADKISQATSSLQGGQGGDANDIGNSLSQAITQLTQGISQLGEMSKKLSSGGDDKAGGPKPKAGKGGGGAQKPEEDAVPGQEGQELADALKAIGDGIKEMGQTISKMGGKDGAKAGGQKSAKGGGEKEEEKEDKQLEPGDPSAAINAIVEGLKDLSKQIGDLGKQLGVGMPGMQGPGGGGAPKGPGGDMQGGPSGGMQGPGGGQQGPGAEQMKGGPSGGMQGPGGGAGGGQSPGGGMDMQGMGGDAAGGMGAPPMPKDKDHFKNEDGKTKDTDEIGKEVGKDFAKEMADPANGGQPEIAAVKVLIKDGPALMEAAKSKAEETALAPVKAGSDVATSLNEGLDNAGKPTEQITPAKDAADEKNKQEAQKPTPGTEVKPAQPSEGVKHKMG